MKLDLTRSFSAVSICLERGKGDIVLIVQKNQKKYKKVLAKMRTLCYTVFRQRECWNWQTGKTKDLVGVCSCGFKSHLPHGFFKIQLTTTRTMV